MNFDMRKNLKEKYLFSKCYNVISVDCCANSWALGESTIQLQNTMTIEYDNQRIISCQQPQYTIPYK